MKKIILTTITVAALALTSCGSDYLDINTDPNNPSAEDLTTDLMLPTVEMNLAASYGDFMRICGGYYAQQYAQTFGTSNYLDYSQFTMSATRSSSLAYTQIYLRVISNAQAVIEKAEASNEKGTVLAATVMKAFAYATLVDNYGETPYTEALSNDITQPHFDEGRTVYDGIIAELEAALKECSSTESVATNFLFPSSNANQWRRFANALLMKLYTRISNVDTSVLPKIKAIMDADELPVSDIAWEGCWTTTSGSESPFYAEEFATNFGSTQINVVANVALIKTMMTTDYTDPRLAAFFEVNGDGIYQGGVSGSNFSGAGASFSDKSFSRPVASYDMPVYLITLSEINFWKAEYYARSNDAKDAATEYANAIQASFESAGVSGYEKCVEMYPYDNTNWKKCIGIAKWVALSGTNNHEAWCEMRRLGYPTFDETISGASIWNGSTYDPEAYTPGTLYTPIQVDANVGLNNILQRWPYASATASNSNTPTQSSSDVLKPVFWAK